MDMFRLIAGLLFLVGGIVLLIVSIFFFPAVIYAIIGIIIGILLLLDIGKEGKIEKIKSKNPLQSTIPATNKHKKRKK